MKVISHKIGTVIDVRKNAFSRKYGFSSNLKGFLSKFGIGYVHFPELGIPSGRRKNLESFSDYQALFKEYESDLESKLKLKIKEIFNTPSDLFILGAYPDRTFWPNIPDSQEMMLTILVQP